MFNVSKVWHANHQSTADIIINQGGTDSGKTYAIMQLLFWCAITENAPPIDPVITIVGESVPNLKKGAYRAAEGIYASTPGLKQYIKFWNKTDRVIYFHNGWIMEFISCENEQSAKNGKRQYLFVNEANGVSYPIFWQLAKRTRRKVFIDYNPSAPFFAHEKIIGTDENSNDFGKTVQLIISDHRHNPFLSEAEHRQTENIKDPELWRVYARGLTGNLKGLIFPGWKMIEDDEFPDVDFFGGLDFGYTNDPTAATKIALVGNNLFLHELCYEPGIAPIQMKQIFQLNKFTPDNHIYCEHDPDQIAQLRRLKDLTYGLARKGNGSVKAGILKLNEYNVFYTRSSKNIHIEKSKYMWEIDKATGKPTNTPAVGFDHCFVADTKVLTIDGERDIYTIKKGDYVLTSKGYSRVVEKWDNGEKQTFKYSMQFDTFTLSLECTNNHKIKTQKGWISIEDLNSTHKVYLNRSLMVKYSTCTQEKDITQSPIPECMLRYGNIIMVKSKKDFMSITKMRTLGITRLKILNVLKGDHTNASTRRSASKMKISKKIFMPKGSKQLKHGMAPRKVLSGIQSKVKIHGSEDCILLKNVNNAIKNTKQGTQDHLNSAIIIAKLSHLERDESKIKRVYDLTVEDDHEYFANGVLVHNCMDSIRYGVYTKFYRA